MSPDIEGTVVIAVQLTALILLTIGVYPYRLRTKNRNLIIHGFLSIIALGASTSLQYFGYDPALGIGVLVEMTGLQVAIVLLHAVLGGVLVALGFIIIFSWITHPLGELGCARTWRLMIPTFAVWAATLVLGLIVHFFEIL